jgi:hypothetical protein
VSEGLPRGRIAELYNPEMFQEHEEVIVFTREEFNQFYNSMQQQIGYINNVDLFLSRSEEWKLLGLWPKIMERINIIDLNMKSILKKEPLQCYLDSSLHGTVRTPSKSTAVTSKKKVTLQSKLLILEVVLQFILIS